MVPAAAAALAAAWVLLFLDVEPVPTWFYVAAWYPTLVLLDAAGRRGADARSLFARPASAIAIGAWSVVIWLLFEAANFRLQNWYYVSLPSHPVERWTGIILSFATVVPAVVLVERCLDTAGLGHALRSRPLRPAPAALRWIPMLGLAMVGSALLLPDVLFPLIWGGVWLIADPIVYVRQPDWSLLRDIEQGRWGRIVRLLVGGLVIGLVWEAYNGWARGRWIYTVPWLEHTKLFEMPPLGFLGFPFFALEAWSLFHALCTFGLARAPFATTAPPRPAGRGLRTAAVLLAAVLSAATLRGMEHYTISSTTPRLEDLPLATATNVRALRAAGYQSVPAVSAAVPRAVADATGLTADTGERLVRMARLTMLRGIGSDHAARLAALGIRSVCGLARWSPGRLWRVIHGAGAAGAVRPTPAEVRIWIRAARERCVADTLATAIGP